MDPPLTSLLQQASLIDKLVRVAEEELLLSVLSSASWASQNWQKNTFLQSLEKSGHRYAPLAIKLLKSIQPHKDFYDK
jgi:hypothetical protein